MKIAIIGAGYTGLTAAYELLKRGHEVTVFEKEKTIGGLAAAWKEKNWNWSLEKSYHHFFTNDKTLLSLINELGLQDKISINRPITATLTNASKRQSVKTSLSETVSMFQLDSPIHLLQFSALPLVDRIRTGALLAFCKFFPFWRMLEGVSAKKFFKTVGGNTGWRILWEPLMKGKFGPYADDVAASWLWARIHKRTPRLGYINGGFQLLADALAQKIKKQGGKIYTNTAIDTIQVQSTNGKPTNFKPACRTGRFQISNFKFDAVLLTVPSPVATKLIQFPKSFETKTNSIDHLSAQMLVLETKKPILEKIYWLNINDRSFPFIAVVPHTNMIDKKQYGGNHITYIGNYLPAGHPFLSRSARQLLQTFKPFLQKINPKFNFKFQILNFKLFTLHYAQPIHTVNYSKKVSPIQTPILGVYLANLDSVVPWDRGINYAIELGKKSANKIHHLTFDI